MVSLTLVSLSLLVAVLGGAILAVAAASAPHGRLDRAITALSQLGVAIPDYAMAPVLILIFAVTLGGLPSSGWDGPASMVLPVLTVSLSALAFCTQMIRAELLDKLSHPSVTVAYSKGLSRRRVMWRHVVPQALTGAGEILGLWLAGLLGGSVVVEVIFAIPGLGRLLYASVIGGDIPMLQGGLIATVAVSMAVFLAIDLLRMLLDPRLRHAVDL
jgi:peptide/nickel transport system permease protein